MEKNTLASLSKSFATLLMAWLLLVSPSMAKITELSSDIRQHLPLLTQDPALLVELIQKSERNDFPPVITAQRAWLLSEAYFALYYPKKAMQQARRGLAAITQQNQPWLYYRLVLAQSSAFDLQGEPLKGLAGTTEALNWAIDHENKALQLDALFIRGMLLTTLLEYTGALQDLQQAYPLTPQPDSVVNKGNVANMIGQVYTYRGEPALSIPFIEESIDYHRQHQQKLELSMSLFNLGKAYKGNKNLQISIELFRESLELSQQLQDIQGEAYALKELADINILHQQYALATTQLSQAKAIFAQSDNPYMQFETASLFVELALRQNQTKLAWQYFLEAKQYLDPNSMPLHQLTLDEIRARILAAEKDYQQAYQLLDDIINQKQKIYNQRSSSKLHQLRSQYELEVKEQRNQLLENENQLSKIRLAQQQQSNKLVWLYFAMAVLVCSMLAFMFYRSLRNRKNLLRLASEDGLTRLYNRRKTMELLQREFEMTQRYELPLCVAIIDLDLFKQINDNFGHGVGDKVLKQFANLCKNTFRHTDIIGRIGGEEFLIALPHTHRDDAERLLDELRNKVTSIANTLAIANLSVSISCGLCQHTDQKDIEALIAHADAALYNAKETGRNRVEVHNAMTHSHTSQLTQA
ncbi:MAG: tetratricopeptide repeat-containing diguanylate cyclase [Cognaticolwellia sp.]